MRILVAEDDIALGLFLQRGLECDGHQVRLTSDGGCALQAFCNDRPDLAILDLNLPVQDGEEVLYAVRAIDSAVPVLVLTARLDLDVRVRCLDRGADDFMTKPFSLHELRARVRVLLRRRREATLVLRAADVELNRLDHSVCRAGQTVDLTNKEFALLEYLMLHRGQCVSRMELLDSVWKMEPAQTTNIVDVYINYVRRKLQDGRPSFLIRTVRGQGYMVSNDDAFAVASLASQPQDLTHEYAAERLGPFN